MYIQIYEYFQINCLLYKSQYGFRKKHSTELAAIELTDRLQKEVEKGNTPFTVFLDLSKAFDTLNHKILLHKLEFYGFDQNALRLMRSYLSDRQQYVEFNHCKSETKQINIGVPQGSILGPLLFLIYMNDIFKASSMFNFILYADDSTLQSTLEAFCHHTHLDINTELEKISNWLLANKLSLNVSKSKYMVFATEKKKVKAMHIKINNVELEEVKTFNFLGLTIDSCLTWLPHINQVRSKVGRIIGILNKLKNFFPVNILSTLYSALILPHLNYAVMVWGHKQHRLVKQQKKAVRVISKSKYNAHTEPIFKDLNMLKLSDIYILKSLIFYYNYKHQTLPQYMCDLYITSSYDVHSYQTRQRNQLRPSHTRMKRNENRLETFLPKLINKTANEIKEKINTHSLQGFKQYIKRWLINKYETVCLITNCYVCNSHH